MAWPIILRTPLIGSRVSRAPFVGDGRAARGRRGAGVRPGGLHVVAGDHAAGAAADERGEVDAEVLGQLAHGRLGQGPRRGRRQRRRGRGHGRLVAVGKVDHVRRGEAGLERALQLLLGRGRTGRGRYGGCGGPGVRRCGRPCCGRPATRPRRRRWRPGWTGRSPARRAGAGASTGSADGAAAPSPIAMIGVPTGTVSPSGTISSCTVPANGDGSSTSDFAVSISTTMSLMATVSPSLTLQVTISASVRPSPTSGSLNSAMGVLLRSRACGRRRRARGRGRGGSPPRSATAGTACRRHRRGAPAPRGSRSTPR